MKEARWFNKKQLSFLEEKSIRSAWERVSAYDKDSLADVSLGNPFDPPPKKVSQVIRHLLKESSSPRFSAYMDNAGYPETRVAIARDLVNQKLFPKGLNENHIIMTVGATGGLNCVLSALLNPQDEVILLCPFFVEFPKYILNHKGIAKIVCFKPPSFDLDTNLIEKAITRKTKAIIVNSPNNPTGKVYSAKKINSFIKLLKEKSSKLKHPIFLISDEVYREIIYPPRKFVSPCTNYSYSIMVYSFSKSLNLAGERIGYVAIHPEMEQADTLFSLIKLANRTLGFTNAPALIQKIIPKILPFKVNIQKYQKARRKLSLTLKKAGFNFQKPEGAFYFLVKIPIKEKKFFTLTDKLGLFVVNSRPFGTPGYFRIAFCQDSQTINRACKKILQLGRLL